MISEGITIALVTGVCAVIGQWLIVSSNRKKDAISQAIKDERTAMRLDNIEKKLDEHNNYAKRFVEIEKAIVEISTELKNLKAGNK